MTRKILSALCCLAIMSATSIADAAYTWEASGIGKDGRPENGAAVFNFTSQSNLSVTLTNTAGVSELGGISSVLDGLTFTLSATPSSITLTGAYAAGTVTATKGVAFDDPRGGITQTGSSPFGWILRRQGDSWELLAGHGSLKPDGIVNENITATDGITNKKHNPYLDGPVTFDFTLTGLSTTPRVTSATFYFGTEPDIQIGQPVPLPPSLVLLASSLVAFAVIKRRSPK